MDPNEELIIKMHCQLRKFNKEDLIDACIQMYKRVLYFQSALQTKDAEEQAPSIVGADGEKIESGPSNDEVESGDVRRED